MRRLVLVLIAITDIFLTPLKPRDKVVSAEDVNSCLYYLHFNRPSDRQLLESAHIRPLLKHNGEQSDPLGSSSPRENIPVRPQPTIEVPERRSPQRILRPPPMRKDLNFNENQAPQRHHANLGPDSSPVDSPPPVPARSQWRNSYVHNGSQIGHPSNEQIAPDLDSAQDTPAPIGPMSKSGTILRRKPVTDDGSNTMSTSSSPALVSLNHNGVSSRDTLSSSDTSKNGSRQISAPAQTLTLVRRIPYSSDQWNVATIADSSADITSARPAPSRSKRNQPSQHSPLFVGILNPGYAKFERTNGNTNSSQSHCFEENVFFHTQLRPDSSYLPSAIAFTSKSSDGSGSHFSDMRFFGHRRASRMSADLTASVRSDEEKRYHRLTLTGVPESQRSSGKHCYSFSSPWQSRCEIVESLTGSSLKVSRLDVFCHRSLFILADHFPRLPQCRHASPALSHLAGPKGPLTVQVSELRFDLPGAYNNAPKLSRKSLDRGSDGESVGSPVVGRGQKSGSSERVDLRLGQERAGGGAQGKKAKLGKLIVEGEGLDMLDLVVAVNLGLWSRAFSRQFE